MLSDFLAHPPLSLFSTSRMTLSLGRVIIAPISPRRDDAPVNCGTHPIAWRSIRVRTRFLSHYHSHGTHARVVLTRPMTAPKPKPRGGQRRAIARRHSAPKTITRVRFERQLRSNWGSSWLVALLAKLASDGGANGRGPPPLERPVDRPARESSAEYDFDAPKSASRVRFERRLRTDWGRPWLVALLAKLASDGGANGRGPPPLERPVDRPARESSEYDSRAAANDAFTRAVFARLAGGDTERGFECLDAAGELGNVGTRSGTAEGRPASAEEEEEERRQSRRRKKKRERCLEVDTALWSAWRNGFLGASKKRQV